jgi:hypothetical protein
MKKLRNVFASLTVMMVANLLAATHFQEGFSSTSVPSGWSENSMYYNSTANHGTYTGGNGAGFNASGDYLYTSAQNSAGSLTFWIKGSSSPSQIGMKIQKSTDASTWTDVETYAKATFSTSWEEKTIAINDASSTIYVRFYIHDRSGNSLYLDDIQLTDYSAAGVDDPTGFTTTTISTSQIDLSWSQNVNNDAVMIVYDSDDTFTDPIDGVSYSGSALGGTVLYNASGTSYNHTSLGINTAYYYKAWSVDGSTNYSSGVTANATTAKNEPSDHVTSFTIAKDGTLGHSAIDLSWTESPGTQAADGYLIKASTSDNISDPSDGSAVADNSTIGSNSGAVNLSSGTTSYEWTGLNAESTYYFKIYPYTNSGSTIDYKTTATVPNGSATTDAAPELPNLIISEVTDPTDVYQTRFIELYNNSGSTIDFSSQTWYISRQTNGGSWEDKQLTGSVTQGATYVAANENANTSDYFYVNFGFMADFDYGGSSGNGDDGYFLYFGGDHTSGTLVDAFGVINEDGTGKAWEYEDSRAVRSGVTQGNQTWTSSEWTISSANVADCNPGALDNDQSLPVELSVFKSAYNHGFVKLYWLTDSEIENQGFIIERALRQAQGPVAWIEIANFGKNPDLLGQGSTTEKTDYSYFDKMVKVGETYSYRLSDVDYRGNITTHPAITVTVLAKDEDLKPGKLDMHPAYPNPFNPDVKLSFELNEAVQTLALEIYDLNGALVQTVTSGAHDAGSYDFNWRGQDAAGNLLPSGVYLVRLAGAGEVQIQRITLLR